MCWLKGLECWCTSPLSSRVCPSQTTLLVWYILSRRRIVDGSVKLSSKVQFTHVCAMLLVYKKPFVSITRAVRLLLLHLYRQMISLETLGPHRESVSYGEKSLIFKRFQFLPAAQRHSRKDASRPSPPSPFPWDLLLPKNQLKKKQFSLISFLPRLVLVKRSFTCLSKWQALETTTI